MDTLIIVSMGLLPLSMISLVFGSSTYSSMPGAKANLSVLGENELLLPSYDNKKDARLQEKHNEANKLVKSARQYSWTRRDLEATSQALLQAVECYEAIREEVNSAVVELNLAILAKARIKVEQERNAPDPLLEELKDYFDNALEWADWYLKEDLGRYEQEVPTYRKKLVKYNDGSK